MNKKETGFFKQYLWSLKRYGLRDIYSCYKEPSTAKATIWRSILTQVMTIDDTETKKKYLTVTSYSCHFFSAGYCVMKEGTWYYRHITPGAIRDIKLTAEEFEEVRECLY